MKIYAILVHPEPSSLNGKLFSQAIDYFKSKKYQTESLDLFHSDFNPWAVYDEIVSEKIIDNYAHKWFSADAMGLLPEFSQREINRLKDSDVLYIQTPIWWWGLPALMKAYIESVFIHNVLFSLENVQSRNSDDSMIYKLLRGKKLILSFTTGSSEKFISDHFTTVDQLIAPIKARFEFVGYEVLPMYHSSALSHETDASDRLLNFDKYLRNLKLS